MGVLPHRSNYLPLFDEARNYARRGWSIVPTIGKRAAHRWKQFQTAPADEPTLRRLFAQPRVTGLAVILGSVSSGLACRDFDDASAYRRWAAEHPDLASDLPTVQTARGFHVYFVGPHGFWDLGDGEYRATSGHYCVLPPSPHPDGPVYHWVVPLTLGALPTLDPRNAGLLPDPRRTLGAVAATRQHTTPPLTTHLCEQGAIPTAIAETLPNSGGQRRRRLFRLAQRLKMIMPGASAAELKPIIRQWFELALPVIRTKEWSETWEDFVAAWQSVKHPVGGTWAEITRAATSIAVDSQGHTGAVEAIIRLCAALQFHHGDGVQFPLSCRKAGEFAGVSHTRAARILKMLVFEGVVELVVRGGEKGSGIAAEYRFRPPQSGPWLYETHR